MRLTVIDQLPAADPAMFPASPERWVNADDTAGSSFRPASSVSTPLAKRLGPALVARWSEEARQQHGQNTSEKHPSNVPAPPMEARFQKSSQIRV
jgi:transposase-like protein